MLDLMYYTVRLCFQQVDAHFGCSACTICEENCVFWIKRVFFFDTQIVIITYPVSTQSVAVSPTASMYHVRLLDGRHNAAESNRFAKILETNATLRYSPGLKCPFRDLPRLKSEGFIRRAKVQLCDDANLTMPLYMFCRAWSKEAAEEHHP